MQVFKQEYVYLVKAKGVNKFKIGKASDIERRLKELETGSPIQLEIFAFKPTIKAKNIEADWHKTLSHNNYKGEWFHLSIQDVINIIKKWEYDPYICFTERSIDDIKVGDIAYISFTSHDIYEVKVLEYDRKINHARVEILQGSDKQIIGWEHKLFADEVRQDPFSAIKNRVTL